MFFKIQLTEWKWKFLTGIKIQYIAMMNGFYLDYIIQFQSSTQGNQFNFQNRQKLWIDFNQLVWVAKITRSIQSLKNHKLWSLWDSTAHLPEEQKLKPKQEVDSIHLWQVSYSGISTHGYMQCKKANQAGKLWGKLFKC